MNRQERVWRIAILIGIDVGRGARTVFVGPTTLLLRLQGERWRFTSGTHPE
jgi:hypothetical protein